MTRNEAEDDDRPTVDGSQATDDEERALVAEAREGNKDALARLVAAHHPFVHAVAQKLFGSPTDADDLTQEVFVKAITSLGTFRGDSAFRTWLYRIAVNHFSRTKRRGLELAIGDFDTFAATIAAVPDERWEDTRGTRATEELRVRCTTGMLVCLERDQRMVFVLGAMFGVGHELGGEVLGITPGAFRVRLHRARHDLYAFMNQRCGLVNRKNPCRCQGKTAGFVRLGLVDPDRLVFTSEHVVKARDIARRRSKEAMETVDDLHERIFREHPVLLTKSRVLGDILANATVREVFGLG